MQLPAEIPQLIVIAITLMAASTLQGAVGFGSALFAVPVMLFLGLDLPQSIAIIVTTSAIQTGYSTIHLRKHVPWNYVNLSLVLRLVGLAVGLTILISLANLDTQLIKQIVGGILMAIVLVQGLWKVKPRESLHPAWTILAFLTSGLMSGLVAMGGPPLVLWVMAHKWSADKTRSFLLASLFLITPIQLPLLYWKFNNTIASSMLFAIICVPLIIASSSCGLWLGKHISKKRLKQIAYAILVILAIVSVLSPLL